jgi:hypothetical protein
MNNTLQGGAPEGNTADDILMVDQGTDEALTVNQGMLILLTTVHRY